MNDVKYSAGFLKSIFVAVVYAYRWNRIHTSA